MHDTNTLAAIVAAGMWANPELAQSMSDAGADMPTIITAVAASARQQVEAIAGLPTRTEADEIMADLQAYFPGAVGLHDQYRAIEALQAQRDELLAALEMVMRRGRIDDSEEAMNRVATAIAKAKGGAA